MFDGLMFDGCKKRQKSAKKYGASTTLKRKCSDVRAVPPRACGTPPKPPGVDTEVSDL